MIFRKILFAFKKKKIKKECCIGERTKLCYPMSCVYDRSGSIVVGRDCIIYGSFVTQENGNIEIGDRVTIRYNTRVGAVNSIKIGNDVIISNNVTIYDNNNHPTDREKRRAICQNLSNAELWKWKYAVQAPVVIEDNVWIGERATILKGVRIGEGSIVAMGAIVTKDVPPNSIVAGNPAKVVKSLE